MKLLKHLITLVALAAGLTSPALQAGGKAEVSHNYGVDAWFMNFDLDWRVAGGLPEKALLVSLQGLANRNAPQLYIVHPPDFQWEITGPVFEFYQRKHGVKYH